MTENTDTTTEQPPVASPSPRPPLRRSSSDRVLAGVAAGFARWLGIDPVIVRVVLVVLAVFGGSGLVLYAIGWLFIPDEGATTSEAERFIAKGDRPGSTLRTVLIVIASIIATLIILNLLSSSSGLWIAGGSGSLLLIATVGALVLWLVNRDKPANPAAVSMASPSVTAPEQAPDAPPTYELPAGFVYGGTGQYPGYVTAAPVPPPPPKPRSYLGLATLSAAVLVMGLLASLSLSAAADIPAVAALAAGVAVLGIGLLIGAFVGRAKWLMWLAVPLLLVTATVSVVPQGLHFPRNATIGERNWTPTTATEAGLPHSLTIGDATLDLTGLTLTPGSTVPVRAEVGIGSMLVKAPPGMRVNVVATSNLGDVSVTGLPSREGTDITVVGELAGFVPADAPTVNLTVDSGIGSVEVRRA